MNDAGRPKRWRRLRRKAAVPTGVVAAALLFFLCASLATPLVGTAEAVSAQKICKWRHHTNWADSLDETESRTFGAISCAPNSGVKTACHVTIVMGPYFDFGDHAHRGWCNATAALPVRRSGINDYAAQFSFALQLVDRTRRWTQAYVGSDRPSDGCSYDYVEGRHTLHCTNVHPQ